MCKILQLIICFGLLCSYSSLEAIPDKPEPLNACIPTPCGPNSECTVISDAATCSCTKGFLGDPPKCRVDVCNPNPCGEHSKCTEIEGRPGCSCDESQDTPDSPIRCKPECVKNANCSSDKACIKYRCIDPCPGICSDDNMCQVDDHEPYCNPKPVESICVTNPVACT